MTPSEETVKEPTMVQTPTCPFATTRDSPRSHHSDYSASLLQATPRGFPIPSKCVLQSQDPIAFPRQHCGFPPYYPGFMCCKWKVNSLKHSEVPPIPQAKVQGLHHSCYALPGRILSLLKLPHACATLQCLTLPQLSHTCVDSWEVLAVPDL